MEDTAIKLFGKKIIYLPIISTAAGEERSGGGENKDGGSDQSRGHTCLEEQRANRDGVDKDQIKANYNDSRAESENPKTPSINEGSKHEATDPKPKTLKKPDKILPCPRCTSMDTKFCYYNNYNVNQPRHFCKSCQRYWTAGGAMRNMPVGAGRRKNKNPIPTMCSPIPAYPLIYRNCIPFLPTSTDSSDTILGKRLRENFLIKGSECDDVLKKLKNAILIPKTLRIDDPDEAAKSSIWASLGIENGNFKPFGEKGDDSKKRQVTDMNSPVLYANPAAFSRSLCFRESA